MVVGHCQQRLCQCGCGEWAWGSYKMGHRPTATYRMSSGRRLHRMMAERALGKPLPPGAVVHHVDGSMAESSGLVICQDNVYHMLLHKRMRVLRAGGNPNTDVICWSCREAKPLSAFGARRRGLCVSCRRKRDVQKYQDRKRGAQC